MGTIKGLSQKWERGPANKNIAEIMAIAHGQVLSWSPGISK